MTCVFGRSLSMVFAMLAATCSVACERASPKPPLISSELRPDTSPTRAAGSSSPVAGGASAEPAFSALPGTVWVEVRGPTLVAFHPAKSNAEVEADTGLAVALDDLSYHLGSAMDSLLAAGFNVRYSSGDTVWMRAGSVRTRFVRAPDSATVGYVFTDALGRRAVLYGVRTYVDLIEYAHEFKRTGAIAPR